MVQNTRTKETPFSLNVAIVEYTFVLLVLTLMLHIVFGLPKFSHETVRLYVCIKELCCQAPQRECPDAEPVMYSLLSGLLIGVLVWLCGRRRAKDYLELCSLEEANKEIDLRFRRILEEIEYLQKTNALNLKSATKQYLPDKLQHEIDEFTKETIQILENDFYSYNELSVDSSYKL